MDPYKSNHQPKTHTKDNKTTRQQQDNKTTTRQQQDNNKTTTRQQQDNNNTKRQQDTKTTTRTKKKKKRNWKNGPIKMVLKQNKRGMMKDDGSGKNVSGGWGLISQWVARYS
jgi:hypothetical protein